MTIDPQNVRSRRTRQAIQAAAVELLKTEGASSTSMEAVAERAGCSRRALYLHFASRADLLVSLIGFIDDTVGIEEARAVYDEAEDEVGQVRAAGLFLGRYHTKIAPVVRAIA